MPLDQVYNPSISFEGSPTLQRFFMSDAFADGVLGPLGSGKSYTCCAKIMRHAMQQEPDSTGMRRTRWAVIRNTYPELRSTTINTWLEIFREEHCGPIRYSHPIEHRIRVAPHGDPRTRNYKPGLDCQVYFLALDNPKDVNHLKSLDLTGAWVNEASEISRAAIDMLTGRVGRFPPADECPATWAGIMMDTNAPDDQSWWYEYAETGARPDALDLSHLGVKQDFSWNFHRQPPALLECEQLGLSYFVSEPGFEPNEVAAREILTAAGRRWCINPASENLKHLRLGYYHQQVQNKSHEWLQRFMQAKYIYYVPGRPWVSEYSDSVMARPVKWDRTLALLGGIDIGGGTLNPAAVIGQRGRLGDWRVLAELSIADIGVDRFSDALGQMIGERFPGVARHDIVFYLDPSAAGRDEIYEVAVLEHLRSKGFNVQLAPTNDPVARRDALALPMGRMNVVHGKPIPGFVVDSGCTMLRAGLAGKWYRRRMQVAGVERWVERPEKNESSHVCDAASYMCSGGGEHAVITRGAQAGAGRANPGGHQMTQPAVQEIDFDPFGGAGHA